MKKLIINQNTAAIPWFESDFAGKILKDWCNDGTSEQDLFGKIQLEINQCTTLEGLRHIYSKYPNYQIKIKDSVIQRKAEIENVTTQIIPNNQIVKSPKTSQNGIDSKQ